MWLLHIHEGWWLQARVHRESRERQISPRSRKRFSETKAVSCVQNWEKCVDQARQTEQDFTEGCRDQVWSVDSVAQRRPTDLGCYLFLWACRPRHCSNAC